ncbi:MAG: AbrB/MazE/SpoVT family DNA-binding domain-containing protein [Thermomicrobiales bacterium]|jgi:AbrB family looped-hinge helix DNA binding protein|nr:AbrB/MazE/SpoVT family DNA-binding domain-containing protein [Thermomicrobiales bacterium]
MTIGTFTVTRQGRLTIPIEFRRALGLQPGDEGECDLFEQEMVIRKARSGAEQASEHLAPSLDDPSLSHK